MLYLSQTVSKEIQMELENVNRICEKYDQLGGGLISILEEIQAKYSYLPENALRQVAEKRGLPSDFIAGVFMEGNEPERYFC